MASLYPLMEQYHEVQLMLEEDEISKEVLEGTLDAIDGEIEDKLESYGIVIKNLKTDSEAIDEEIKRLTARKRAVDNNVKNLLNYIQAGMILTGKTKIKTKLFSFGIQKNTPAVVLDVDIDHIPIEFHIKQPDTIDKKKIKEYLSSGEECAFAHLEQTFGVRMR